MDAPVNRLVNYGDENREIHTVGRSLQSIDISKVFVKTIFQSIFKILFYFVFSKYFWKMFCFEKYFILYFQNTCENTFGEFQVWELGLAALVAT